MAQRLILSFPVRSAIDKFVPISPSMRVECFSFLEFILAKIANLARYVEVSQEAVDAAGEKL
jgi:hypothetical protein